MASELENKKFVEEVVRPFFQKRLPGILERLDDVENMAYPFGKHAEELKTMPSSIVIDVGLEAWKKQTYGG